MRKRKRKRETEEESEKSYLRKKEWSSMDELCSSTVRFDSEVGRCEAWRWESAMKWWNSTVEEVDLTVKLDWVWRWRENPRRWIESKFRMKNTRAVNQRTRIRLCISDYWRFIMLNTILMWDWWRWNHDESTIVKSNEDWIEWEVNHDESWLNRDEDFDEIVMDLGLWMNESVEMNES